MTLTTCEDTTRVTIYRDGERRGRGENRKIHLTVRKVGTKWEVWSGTGTKVKSCDN